MKYTIKDWMNNDLSWFYGTFFTFDDAECALCEFLGDQYETDRQEYFIEEIN